MLFAVATTIRPPLYRLLLTGLRVVVVVVVMAAAAAAPWHW